MQELSDEILVTQYLNGDQESLEILIQKYLKPLYNFVFKYVRTTEAAEDITQESFVKIWKNLKKFDHKYKFKTWAFTIAKNTALDHLKKKSLVPFSDFSQTESGNTFENSLTSFEPLPEELMGKLDDVQMMGHVVNRLPKKYQRVVFLRYQQQLNFREIAELLKQSINTIKTQHRRALVYLKKRIQDK